MKILVITATIAKHTNLITFHVLTQFNLYEKSKHLLNHSSLSILYRLGFFRVVLGS